MVQDIDIELVNNQQQRLPCVLILDGSYSMQGARIEQLNAGLKVFEEQVKADEIACERVQLMVIRCGGDVSIEADWIDAESFDAPRLEADGGTPLGLAVELAAQKIEERKVDYRNAGVNYLKPWVFIISDGEPNDDNWEFKADDFKNAELDGKFTTFAVGVEDADLNCLNRFAQRDAMMLKGIEFTKLFVWLSKSVRVASKRTTDNEQTALPPVDWSTV